MHVFALWLKRHRDSAGLPKFSRSLHALLWTILAENGCSSTCGTLLICVSSRLLYAELPVNDCQLWGQSASIVLKFPGLKWGTRASLWHSNLALLPRLLLTRSNRRAAYQRPFLDSLCDPFPCVCLTLTSAACNCFLTWFTLPFIPRAGKGKKVKLGGAETGNKKNPTWQL